MNRTTLAVFATAAVIGLSGGIVAAVSGGDPAKGAPSATSSTADPTPSPPFNGEQPVAVPLTYLSAGVIHEGESTSQFPGKERVVALQRGEGGYLVTTSAAKDSDDVTLWLAPGDGTRRRVAAVRGTYAVNAEGNRVVGRDVSTGALTVWAVDGSTVGTWNAGSFTGSAVFVGDEVLISRQQPVGTFDELRWSPGTGQPARTDGIGYDDLGASSDGRHLGGAVGTDGVSSDDGNVCVGVQASFLVASQTAWRSCDWRTDGPLTFSPDGTRVLVIPAESDGFGPGEFGVIDAAEGPRGGLQVVDAPDWTLGAEWADNTHLYVYGSTNPDGQDVRDGMFVQKCTIGGACQDVVRTTDTPIVVSSES